MNVYDALNEALRIIATSKVYDGDLPGGKWCEECGIRTNHRDHGDVKPDEEPLDDPDYRDEGGEC